MKVKNYLLLLVIVVLPTGCIHNKEEYSSLLTEDAEVADLLFTPSKFRNPIEIRYYIGGAYFVPIRVYVP